MPEKREGRGGGMWWGQNETFTIAAPPGNNDESMNGFSPFFSSFLREKLPSPRHGTTRTNCWEIINQRENNDTCRGQLTMQSSDI